ncbi:uncharacterized protein C8Q71DRAFT_496702 [Rhodofomes roseus]|uniref:Secreted protein n=1 Tax=Rhodofomes roseus TaxID=34475 RepID=A0ABQ8KLM6_9APHY|nr:uncharacterized protein C8Q71DRAFT_496702 [Rhodofomes roseus]KAH9839111.1 hypothetical protein C8Q71DRAFT_496702 [Rhodofomes roseus]
MTVFAQCYVLFAVFPIRAAQPPVMAPISTWRHQHRIPPSTSPTSASCAAAVANVALLMESIHSQRRGRLDPRCRCYRHIGRILHQSH